MSLDNKLTIGRFIAEFARIKSCKPTPLEKDVERELAELLGKDEFNEELKRRKRECKEYETLMSYYSHLLSSTPPIPEGIAEMFRKYKQEIGL